tara:strand:+ start:310 stop:639 length:330 start_codon:yes stop_codon:yes gene_type:complete
MWELERQVEELVMKYLEESGAVYVGARDVGLDYRCGRVHISVEEDFVAVNGIYSIEYYGGFEYIDSDYKTTIGHITFYSGEHSRVRDAIDYYKENATNNNQEELEGEQT